MAKKQGVVGEITQKEMQEFKSEGVEGKKTTSIITILNGKPHRVYFEDGKRVKVETI